MGIAHQLPNQNQLESSNQAPLQEVKTFAQNGALLRNFLPAARKELRHVGTNHTNSAHHEKCLFMNRMRERSLGCHTRTRKKRTRQEDHRSVERFLGLESSFASLRRRRQVRLRCCSTPLWASSAWAIRAWAIRA